MLRLFRILKLLQRRRNNQEADDIAGNNPAQSDNEMNAYRTKLAKAHAAVVEMRVVGGVILMLLVLPNLDYTTTDQSDTVGLELMNILVTTNASDTTLLHSMNMYFSSQSEMVTLSVRGFLLTRPVFCGVNVINTNMDGFSDPRWVRSKNKIFWNACTIFERTKEWTVCKSLFIRLL